MTSGLRDKGHGTKDMGLGTRDLGQRTWDFGYLFDSQSHSPTSNVLRPTSCVLRLSSHVPRLSSHVPQSRSLASRSPLCKLNLLIYLFCQTRCFHSAKNVSLYVSHASRTSATPKSPSKNSTWQSSLKGVQLPQMRPSWAMIGWKMPLLLWAR